MAEAKKFTPSKTGRLTFNEGKGDKAVRIIYKMTEGEAQPLKKADHEKILARNGFIEG